MARNGITVNGKLFRKFIDRAEIERQVKRVAHEIECSAKDNTPLFVCVLNGSFVFAADLLRNIESPCEVCFVRLASYEGTSSTGCVKNILGLNADISGKDIIIIEDIVETGRTLQALHKTLLEKNAKSVSIASLVSKPSRLETDIIVKYCGFKMKDTDFIVGYGMDYNGQGRNIPDIYIAAE